MLDGEQIDNWVAPVTAGYWMGQDGLRVFPRDNPSRVVLFIDACAVTDLRKLARDALSGDALWLTLKGETFVIDEPHHMARDILSFT